MIIIRLTRILTLVRTVQDVVTRMINLAALEQLNREPLTQKSQDYKYVILILNFSYVFRLFLIVLNASKPVSISILVMEVKGRNSQVCPRIGLSHVQGAMGEPLTDKNKDLIAKDKAVYIYDISVMRRLLKNWEIFMIALIRFGVHPQLLAFTLLMLTMKLKSCQIRQGKMMQKQLKYS